jgi:carbon-monoxide dehydrogenase large subunit
MSETGIGARVRRKEDHRFITGKGQYTDDINLRTSGPIRAQPHAHATIKSIKPPQARKSRAWSACSPAEVAEDKIGG